jgi:hypothetical protein
MKNVITLTKTLTLSLLLLLVVGASASPVTTGDDTSKCKKRCCKAKASDKEVQLAIKEVNEAMQELSAQLKNLEGAKIKVEVQSLAQLPVKLIKTTNGFILSYAPEAETSQVGASQKIDFQNLDKEMDKVQEDMTQMDPALQKDDAKSRKPAEELLKTGIKS